MVVAYLLEAEGRALEHVAAAFGLDSASPLRNLMKRYTGLRSLEVRTGGGLKVVVAGIPARRRVRTTGIPTPQSDDPSAG